MCAENPNVFSKTNLHEAGTYANANVGRCDTDMCNGAGMSAPRAAAAALTVAVAVLAAANY